MNHQGKVCITGDEARETLNLAPAEGRVPGCQTSGFDQVLRNQKSQLEEYPEVQSAHRESSTGTGCSQDPREKSGIFSAAVKCGKSTFPAFSPLSLQSGQGNDAEGRACCLL